MDKNKMLSIAVYREDYIKAGQIAPALQATQLFLDLNFDFVTDPTYYRVLGKFFKRETSSLLKSRLRDIDQHSRIIPWRRENLVEAAKRSSLSIIPINLSSPLQYLKPENRLLIMWRLGLPCLTSPSPAYIRVAEAAKTDTICYSINDWTHKINTILENPDLAESIVAKGQSYLNENHNRDSILKKWDTVFESVRT